MGNRELKQRLERSISPRCEKHNHIMTYGRYSKKAEYRGVHKRVDGVLYYCTHCADDVTKELKQETRSPLERKKTLAINEVDEGICDISKVMRFPYRIMRYIHPYPDSIELVVFARLGEATRERIKTIIANLATDLEVMFSDYSGDIIPPSQ